jgi:hypothetical protein
MGREIDRPRKLFDYLFDFLLFSIFFLQSKVKTLPSLLSLSLSLKHSSLLGCYDEFADAGGGAGMKRSKRVLLCWSMVCSGLGFSFFFLPPGSKGGAKE